MKKFTTFLAAATFVVALSSCGNKQAENTEATATDSTAMTTEAPAVDSAAATVDTAAAATVDTAAAAAPAEAK